MIVRVIALFLLFFRKINISVASSQMMLAGPHGYALGGGNNMDLSTIHHNINAYHHVFGYNAALAAAAGYPPGVGMGIGGVNGMVMGNGMGGYHTSYNSIYWNGNGTPMSIPHSVHSVSLFLCLLFFYFVSFCICFFDVK